MRIKALLLLLVSTILVGCVGTPQSLVSLDNEILMHPDNRIGVAMDALPKPGLGLPGADCLLCLAVAAGANSDLSSHAKQLSTAEVEQLKPEVVAALKEQGKDSVLIKDQLNIIKLPKTKKLGDGFSKRDFSGLAEELQVDQLLVIDINSIGMTRSYASYVPTSPPQATVLGTVFLVDVGTNAYHWYMPLNLRLSAEGEWKEPPEFPGLTNAYYQVIEKLRDMVLESLPKSPDLQEVAQ